MAYNKKTWKDRVSEHPARRILTDLQGNSEVYSVARNEGSVSQEGDAFSAANMNDLETRINTALAGCSIVLLTQAEYDLIPVADRDDTIIYMCS